MNLETHFEKQYNKAINTSNNIDNIIYSKEIWHKFLRLIPSKDSKILDIGCGYGTFLGCLYRSGFKNLYGMDIVDTISPELKDKVNFVKLNLIKDQPVKNYYDVIVSTMVIEHQKDDDLFASRIYEMLKPGGISLITSVLKKDYSWYFYKNIHGETALEPSHYREYRSVMQYKKVFSDFFEIISVKTTPVRYSLIDPLFRFFYNRTKKSFFKESLTKDGLLPYLKKFKVRIPRYRAIEIIVKKSDRVS